MRRLLGAAATFGIILVLCAAPGWCPVIIPRPGVTPYMPPHPRISSSPEAPVPTAAPPTVVPGGARVPREGSSLPPSPGAPPPPMPAPSSSGGEATPAVALPMPTGPSLPALPRAAPETPGSPTATMGPASGSPIPGEAAAAGGLPAPALNVMPPPVRVHSVALPRGFHFGRGAGPGEAPSFVSGLVGGLLAYVGLTVVVLLLFFLRFRRKK